ncbi:MAG: ATP-binding protein [Halobacteria archaeon]
MTDLGDFDDSVDDWLVEDSETEGGDEPPEEGIDDKPDTDLTASEVEGEGSELDPLEGGSDDKEPEFEEYGFEESSVEGEALGVLSASKEIAIGTENQLTAYITAENRGKVRVGRYFEIPYPDGEKLFVKVRELRYVQEFQSDDATEIHAKRMMAEKEVDETDYKFLAQLEPVAVVEGENRRMPDRLPKPNARLLRSRDKSDVKTGLDIPYDGVFVGHLAVGGEKVETAGSPPTIDYRIKDSESETDPLVFRHFLVAGGTGSGKSHTTKNVLRQFLGGSRYTVEEDGGTASRRPGMVVFDPQNEYSEMHDDNPEVDDGTKRRWDAEGVHYGGYDDTVCFVPKIDGYSYSGDHGAPQKEFSVPFRMAEDSPWLLAGADLSENQYLGLRRLLDDYFDHAETPSYRGFTEFVTDVTREEYYVENGRIHEATYKALKRKVADNSVFDRVFDSAAEPIDSDEMIGQFVSPGRLTVVPTYHVTSSRTEEVVVLALASLLVDNKLSTGGVDSIKQTPLILGMDEAHNFLADADTAQGRKIRSKFSEAAKQGRKERLGLFLITQDPGDIADAVFKQINTKLVLNLGDESAIKSLNLPSDLENRVPYLEKGEMAIYSPDNSVPVEVVGLENSVTRHG